MARRNFKDFVAAGIDCEPEYCLNEGEEWVEISSSGEQEFVPGRRQKEPLLELEALVCLSWELPTGTLCRPGHTRVVTEARGALGWLATEFKIATLPVVARHLKRSLSSLRDIVRRFDERLKNPKEAKVLTERLLRVVGHLPSEVRIKRMR